MPVCRAQFIELKQLSERMAGRERVSLSHSESMEKKNTAVLQRLQTLNATILKLTPRTQMEDAIKNTARSISANFRMLQDASEKKLEARMDGMDGVIEKHNAKWTEGFFAAANSMEAHHWGST